MTASDRRSGGQMSAFLAGDEDSTWYAKQTQRSHYPLHAGVLTHPFDKRDGIALNSARICSIARSQRGIGRPGAKHDGISGHCAKR
jgi:hypothetical protein